MAGAGVVMSGEDFREFARELAQHLKDYELVRAGYLREETWQKKARKLVARGERFFDLVPF